MGRILLPFVLETDCRSVTSSPDVTQFAQHDEGSRSALRSERDACSVVSPVVSCNYLNTLPFSPRPRCLRQRVVR